MNKKCEHCKGELVQHDGSKEGFWHCADCGCCFMDDKSTVRPGHPVCSFAPEDAKVEPAPPAYEEEAVAEEPQFEVVAEEEAPPTRRKK